VFCSFSDQHLIGHIEIPHQLHHITPHCTNSTIQGGAHAITTPTMPTMAACIAEQDSYSEDVKTGTNHIRPMRESPDSIRPTRRVLTQTDPWPPHCSYRTDVIALHCTICATAVRYFYIPLLIHKVTVT